MFTKFQIICEHQDVQRLKSRSYPERLLWRFLHPGSPSLGRWWKVCKVCHCLLVCTSPQIGKIVVRLFIRSLLDIRYSSSGSSRICITTARTLDRHQCGDMYYKYASFLLLMVNQLGWSAGARARSSRMPAKPIKLYYFPPSPPCRAVMMAARAVGLELELVLTDVGKGEQLTPEFLKMNPQHTIPTMDDNGFILWESRAIMAYFVNAYGKDDALYPKNPRNRALVDAKLNFDLGILFPRWLDLYRPVLFMGQDMDVEQKKKLDEALGFLEAMLAGKTYVAGDNLTIADISIVITLTNLNALGYELESYPNIMGWFERTGLALEPYGYQEIDQAGAQIFASFLNKDN